jgi:hypothetical protein
MSFSSSRSSSRSPSPSSFFPSDSEVKEQEDLIKQPNLIEEDQSDSQEIANVTEIGELSRHNASMIRVLNTGDSATKQQRALIHKRVSRIKVASAELSGAGMDVITMHRYNWKPHNWTTFISPSLSRDEEVNSHKCHPSPRKRSQQTQSAEFNAPKSESAAELPRTCVY